MSITAKVITVTNENKAALATEIMNLYHEEGCGICEKKGAEVFWFSIYSRCAHAKCVVKIRPAETQLLATIDKLFECEVNRGPHNFAHMVAIKAIKRALGPGSLETHLEKQGEKVVTEVFNTVGIEAAKRYAATTRLSKL